MFGYGHGVLNVTVNKEALGAMGGGSLGLVQSVGLQSMDANGQLGGPVFPGPWGTVSSAVNMGTGMVAGGLSAAALFGKGPLKNHPAVMAGGLTYAAVTTLATTIAVLTGAPSTKVPQMILNAKRQMTVTTGKSASPGNFSASVPSTGSQAAAADTFA